MYNQEYVEITNMALSGKKSVISQQQSYEAFSGKEDIWLQLYYIYKISECRNAFF